MESLPIIDWALNNLNYLTITLLMIIESSFIPFPSEVIIPPAAYMAASNGEMNLGLILLFGTVGAIIGALINYGLAIWLGRPIIYRFARSRAGAFFLLDADKVLKAEQFFVKHGKVATFTGRLVPGIRQLISIPAGLARMNIGSFILYSALGAGIWNLILLFLGWYAEKVVPYNELMPWVERNSHIIGCAILAIVGIALVHIILKALRRPEIQIIDSNQGDTRSQESKGEK